MGALYEKLENILSYGHLFDFVTCWSHWLLFVVVVIFPAAPQSIICGARLSVLATSIVGTLILLGRGKDTLPLIKKRLYVYEPSLVHPFFESYPTIFGIDCLWHGVPMWFVLSSKALPEAEVFNSVLTVGALGGTFLLFEYFIRGIDPYVTYGLKAVGTNTPSVLTGIALSSVCLFSTARDPMTVLAGWRGLLGNLVRVPEDDVDQLAAAALAIAAWYWTVTTYARNCASEKSFKEMVARL
ncbi:hypothetical protein TeGR_g4398 [Tetraparma gracilis]|uniref:Uncharacterized protein n=1 Tax=Tetraparma gracilis TaxID=2962635 RepID=A0ABQ6N4D8_9STRA|nr:hypothetical protein TeGR_g4398 [Tetraparma gracilis]